MTLPDTVILKICKFADVDTVGRVACCCKRWNTLIDSNVWRRKYARTYGLKSNGEFFFDRELGEEKLVEIGKAFAILFEIDQEHNRRYWTEFWNLYFKPKVSTRNGKQL
jgi:hypothetical protein